MVTEDTRNDVWQEYLDFARLVRYYEALAKRYSQIHLIIRYLLLLPFISSLALLFDFLTHPLQVLLGALIGIVVAADLVYRPTRKAAVAHIISIECSKLEIEWMQLWNNANARDSNDEDVQKRNDLLSKKLNEITGRAGEVGIHENRKLNMKCADDAYRIMSQKFAPSA